jgi:hypothetical protein
MPVRRVDHDGVDLGLHQLGEALEEVAARPDRGGDAQATQVVLARVRVLLALLDVLDRDEAAQVAGGVDHGKLLDPVLVQDRARLVEVRADRRGPRAAPAAS